MSVMHSYCIAVEEFGDPPRCAKCVVDDLPMAPGPTDVLVEIAASPINPADLLEIQGSYAGTQLPFIAGAEGAGFIVDRGKATSAKRGDLVMCLGRGNWRGLKVVAESQIVVLPPELDVRQAAMLRVNPATAYLLLTEVVPLAPGDWIAFNAANSSVGSLLAELAGAMGLKAIAVSRKTDETKALLSRGASAVLPDNDELTAAVLELTGGVGLRAAFDCVAGQSSKRLADAMAPEGLLCVYGHLCGEPCAIPSRALTFGQLQVRGFNLGNALHSRNAQAVRKFYGALANRMVKGQLHTPVARTYALEQIAQALEHAASSSGSKIQLAPGHPRTDQ